MACARPISILTSQGPIKAACKQCLNCRIMRQSGMVARCLLENATSTYSMFSTFTYANAPAVGDYADMRQFMKKLHRHEKYHYDSRKIRYLSVGEYGSKSGRFHFHSLLFHLPHPDMGPTLTELWQHGHSYHGTVTQQSIRYTARYTLKFESKGEESCTGWSKKPPLGANGIRSIARLMRSDPKQRYGPPNSRTAPCTIQIQGRCYPLPRILQREFMREFYLDETWKHDASVAAAHLEYLTQMKLGDPIEADRNLQNYKNTFWETVRLNYGTF